MNALLTFSTALSDPVRLRILNLVRDHKADFGGMREVLGLSEEELARHARLLVEAGLLKADKSGKQAKIKHKHAALLEKLFTHFKISSKKEAQLGADQKKLRQLRDKKHPKASKKAAGKKTPEKKRAK